MNLQIISIVEDTMLKDGKTIPAIRVQWKLGDYGPFFDSFPKDTFSAAAVNERADAMRAQLQALVR
jgi:hypothetical protein